ncbi:izumo sperm-egg fusion protein 3 isoform X2 [Engystomops pustulosus]|uniref:izumo sperm-egg fusion protein 3 isoform X2 n=1 Tax=Engystomops pustulosus TaxID=76066 RepID=UPI003AFA2A2A
MAFWSFLFVAVIFPAWAMLDCDPAFVQNLNRSLSNFKVAKNGPNLESVSKDILGIYPTFFRDVRGVEKLRKMVLDKLAGDQFVEVIAMAAVERFLPTDWRNTFMTNIKQMEKELMWQMKKSLEDFSDLACSRDCSVIEGPVLDCWTCDQITAQCFKGSVCGEQEDFAAEKEHIGIYLVLVLQFVFASSLMIMFYHYYKVKMMRLKEQEIKLLKNMKEQVDRIHDR